MGLVGSGAWAARSYGPVLRDDPATVFVGIWSRHEMHAQRLAEALGVRHFPTLAALLAEVDAVAIAVAPESQATLALEAIRRHKHVLLEKPATVTVTAAATLLGALARHPVVVRQALGFRVVPQLREFLGGHRAMPSWAEVTFLSAAQLRGPYRGGWRASAGTLADLGPHAIDLLEQLCGPTARVRCTVRGRWAVLSCEHGTGAAGHVVVSDAADVEAPRISLLCGDGRHDSHLALERVRPVEYWADVWQDFVTAVVDGGAAGVLPGLAHAVHLVAVVAAAQESARSGAVVPVPAIPSVTPQATVFQVPNTSLGESPMVSRYSAEVFTELDDRSVQAARGLIMDAIDRTGTGHPGAAISLAPAAYVLWSRFLRFDPSDPRWPQRDRVLFSNGHAVMLQYAALHLSGYDVTMDDLKQLRQLGSRTPGHPEYGVTPGVEATTGPLGQGVGNAVGMAMAACWHAAKQGAPGQARKPRIWVFASDGDLMEGIAAEASSLAGHLRLANLTMLYDDNAVTIDGPADLAFSEDVAARYRAYGWDVRTVKDANDLCELDAAMRWALQSPQPSLIRLESKIAYGSPHLQGSPLAHGMPLGPEETRLTKLALGLDPARQFTVADEIYAAWRRSAAESGRPARASEPRLPDDPGDLGPAVFPEPMAGSTRAFSGRVLGYLARHLDNLVGGSADLTETTFTALPGARPFAAGSPGRQVHFGVREHAMAAVASGIALYGGIRPFVSTFLAFSDYMRPSIRLAAMMGLPVIYVLTHDSIGLSGDGPTHQPVEHLASLRAMPGLVVLRPADCYETAAAWRLALARADGPTAIVLCRQDVPILDIDSRSAANVARGAYCARQSQPGRPDLVLIATGSEVATAVGAAAELEQRGLNVRVVSMPSWELFSQQPLDYRVQLLPAGIPRLAVEAAASFGWERWVGDTGATVSIDRFGACGQGDSVMRMFGFTAGDVAARALELLAAPAEPPS